MPCRLTAFKITAITATVADVGVGVVVGSLFRCRCFGVLVVGVLCMRVRRIRFRKFALVAVIASVVSVAIIIIMIIVIIIIIHIVINTIMLTIKTTAHAPIHVQAGVCVAATIIVVIISVFIPSGGGAINTLVLRCARLPGSPTKRRRCAYAHFRVFDRLDPLQILLPLQIRLNVLVAFEYAL